MASPWPTPDYEEKMAMCCLCFGVKRFDELSMTAERELTDVCMDCRFIEIRLILHEREPSGVPRPSARATGGF